MPHTLKWTPEALKAKSLQAKEWVVRRYREALQGLTTLRAKMQDIPHTNYELGVDHLRRGNLRDATLRFRMVVKWRPAQALAHYQLGRVWLLRQEPAKGIPHLERARELDPSLAETTFLLATVGRAPLPEEVPLTLIQDHFGPLASLYDEERGAEGYQLARYMEQALPLWLGSPETPLSLLELGCGTGLLGKQLRLLRPTLTLTGVDATPEMLERAAHLPADQGYHTLCGQDFRLFLKESHERYGAILAGCSLHYQRDLAGALRALTPRLAPQGRVLFYVETAADPDATAPTLSLTHRHFAYPVRYVHQAITEAGFTLLHQQLLNLTGNQPGVECIVSAGTA